MYNTDTYADARKKGYFFGCCSRLESICDVLPSHLFCSIHGETKKCSPEHAKERLIFQRAKSFSEEPIPYIEYCRAHFCQ